jgi:hypothetical protein
VAFVKNLRRLRSTASSATTTLSAIERLSRFHTSENSPHPIKPAAVRARTTHLHVRAKQLPVLCSFRLAGGGALYTNDHHHPCEQGTITAGFRLLGALDECTEICGVKRCWNAWVAD